MKFVITATQDVESSTEPGKLEVQIEFDPNIEGDGSEKAQMWNNPDYHINHLLREMVSMLESHMEDSE